MKTTLLLLAMFAFSPKPTCFRTVTYDGAGFADRYYWMQLKKTTPDGICAVMSRDGDWVVETPLTPVVAHHFTTRDKAISFGESACPSGQGDYWWEAVATAR